VLLGGAAFGGAVLADRHPIALAAPAPITSDRERPHIPYGVMSGDPTGGRARSAAQIGHAGSWISISPVDVGPDARWQLQGQRLV
jgi:hypothetical protein